LDDISVIKTKLLSLCWQVGADDQLWARAIWASKETISAATGKDDSRVGELAGEDGEDGGCDGAGCAVVLGSSTAVAAELAAIQAAMPRPASRPWPSLQPFGEPARTASRKDS
jgi:hypothetical protein